MSHAGHTAHRTRTANRTPHITVHLYCIPRVLDLDRPDVSSPVCLRTPITTIGLYTFDGKARVRKASRSG